MLPGNKDLLVCQFKLFCVNIRQLKLDFLFSVETQQTQPEIRVKGEAELSIHYM